MITAAVAELEQSLRQLLPPLPEIKRVWVGFSGGLDSTVLLWLASRVIPAEQIQALYINHNLQKQADKWHQHCAAICQPLGVFFSAISVSPKSSSENDARDARYQAFESQLTKGDLLLLGHHQDDQAETVLMRLFRGASVVGLAGMPQQRPLGEGRLLRPLLNVPRSTLEKIARDAGLVWVEDPSNAQSQYLRNWVRNELGELLSQRWPGWSSRLAQSAANFEKAADLHRELALIDAQGEFTNPLPLSPAVRARPNRLENLIYYWLREQGTQVSSRRQLEDLQAIACVQESAVGRWTLGEASVHLYREQLWYEATPIATQQTVRLRLEPGCSCLSSGVLEAELADFGLPFGAEVELRGRQPGDRLNLGLGHQSVKKFMNDKKLPPWLRDSWPLIVLEGEIISIVGVWSSAEALQPGGLQLKWLR